MAEVVNRNSERILPQFEEIIKIKLFSNSEMKEIIQRHVEYEYKVAKREKRISDFQQYITYKTDLLKLVRIRMKVKNVDKKDKKKIESMLIKHINKLYNIMLKYYPTRESVWLDQIDFMTAEKNYAKVVLLYDSLLSFHMGSAELFAKAAKFMVKYIHDIGLARKTLFRGIRIHKRSELLYLEFVKMELEYSSKKRKQYKKGAEILDDDPVLCGKTAEVICFSALKKVNGLNFKVSLLKLCSEYNFTKNLQKEIYEMMKTQHYSDANMWKHIAQLQLSDIDIPVSETNADFEMVMESPTYPMLRSSYMDWVILKNDLLSVRNIFSNMIKAPPFDAELFEIFKKMITLETSQSQVDVKQTRWLFTMACFYFGSTHTDLWLDYLQFERLHGDAANVTSIYWQAVKELEPTLSDKFIAEYSVSKAA